MRNAYWVDRDAHDRGSSVEDYWAGVATRVGAQPRAEISKQLAEIDASAWATIRADAESVLADVKAAGSRIAILSNAPHPMAAAARASGWGQYIDHWFFSCELEVAKPDLRVYEIVTERVGVAPRSILFFDDRQVNVEGASASGWDARLWTSGERTREVLLDLGIL
ncbi:hypothetical protein MMM2322_01479 [Microbacterium sp. MM2322]